MANANQNIPASPAQRAQPGTNAGTTAAKPATTTRPSPTAAIRAELDQNKASINALQTGVSNLSGQLTGLMQFLQNQQQVAQQPVIPQQTAGVVRPIVRPAAGPIPSPVNNGPQPVSFIPNGNGQTIIDRSEAGPQSRADNCACCGQRRRDGTVALNTGEYVASGMTTAWLRLQEGILVHLADDNFRQVYTVSGQWLADTLSKRQRDERATSVPGFLCGERSSNHPSVRIAQAIMRRATKDEEQTQYATRILRAAQAIQAEGYSLEG